MTFMKQKIKYFILKIKSGIRYFWHVFCVKTDMDTQIDIIKKAEKICKDAELYLQNVEERDYIPSCDEFYQKYGYNIFDIAPLLGNKELVIAMNKIELQERVMLNRYAILANPEYIDSKGITHKLDKKILNKRFDKIMNKK